MCLVYCFSILSNVGPIVAVTFPLENTLCKKVLINSTTGHLLELNQVTMMAGESNKSKLISVPPEMNKYKRHQGSDLCTLCKVVISNDVYCVQCQWCQGWEHSKCTDLSDEECIILSESPPKLMCFCTTCIPKVDSVPAFFDAKSSANLAV